MTNNREYQREYMRKWRRKNHEKAKEQTKRSVYKNRYGNYQLKEACETCGKKENLVRHHKEWLNCDACNKISPTIPAKCKIEQHIQTLCASCHTNKHCLAKMKLPYDWKHIQLLLQNESHLRDISNDRS